MDHEQAYRRLLRTYITAHGLLQKAASPEAVRDFLLQDTQEAFSALSTELRRHLLMELADAFKRTGSSREVFGRDVILAAAARASLSPEGIIPRTLSDLRKHVLLMFDTVIPSTARAAGISKIYG